MGELSEHERKEYDCMAANTTQMSLDVSDLNCKMYGYVRVSTPQQSMERQIRNIKSAYPDATIIQEKWTGTTMARPAWEKLYRKLKPGDIIIFDSVSRMSRDASEGFQVYSMLFSKDIRLIFLKEPHVNTDTFKKALSNVIPLTGSSVDLILKGVNNYLLELAREQIRIAFEQSEKEVKDLQQRTREGIETARINGKQIGQKQGNILKVKKKDPAKDIILKHSKSSGGSLSNPDCMKLAGVSRTTFYKYKKEQKSDN